VWVRLHFSQENMMHTQNTNTPVVELVNLQYCDFASRGPPCYQANVRIDGVDAGTVRNDGGGGASCYSPPDLRDRVEAIARLQPPLDIGDDRLLDMDGDTFLALLVYRTLDTPDNEPKGR
jgi:hypothetical protein